MVFHGLEPIKIRKTNYSFPRNFGAVSPLVLPDEYNADAGISVPDQNADGFPNGCRGYTQNELCQDEDRVPYKSSYVNEQTRLREDTPVVAAGDIYVSLKVVCVDGVQRDNETTYAEALTHKRGQYFQLERTNGLDWFDAMRSAMWKGQQKHTSISIGTPWYPEMQDPPKGVVETVDITAGGYDVYSGHNWKISGWKTIKGKPYLIGKPWCGSSYGDHGFLYLSRDAINTLMKVPGTAAFTLGLWDGTIQTVRWNLIYAIQFQLMYLIHQLQGR